MFPIRNLNFKRGQCQAPKVLPAATLSRKIAYLPAGSSPYTLT